MSFSSEIKEWGVAIKELWQEEHRKHPYLHWIVAAFVFLYFVVHALLAWMDK